MVAQRHGTATMLGRLAITVVPPRERIRRSGARPAFEGCESSGLATSPPGESSADPFVGLGLVLQTAAPKTAAPRERASASFRPPKLSVPVPKAPVLPGAPGGPGWLGVLFYAVVMLAGAALLLLVLSFAKERWNP